MTAAEVEAVLRGVDAIQAGGLGRITLGEVDWLCEQLREALALVTSNVERDHLRLLVRAAARVDLTRCSMTSSSDHESYCPACKLRNYAAWLDSAYGAVPEPEPVIECSVGHCRRPGKMQRVVGLVTVPVCHEHVNVGALDPERVLRTLETLACRAPKAGR